MCVHIYYYIFANTHEVSLGAQTSACKTSEYMYLFYMYAPVHLTQMHYSTFLTWLSCLPATTVRANCLDCLTMHLPWQKCNSVLHKIQASKRTSFKNQLNQ